MKKAEAVFVRQKIMITSFLAIVAGSTIYSIGLHFFISPIGAYAGGVTGLSQIVIKLLAMFGISTIPLGILTIVFNIPLMIFGWFKVEKRFIVLSAFAVVYIGVLLSFFDTLSVTQFSDDLLVNILFGGLLLGFGGGTALRYGGSLGGVDILLAYLSYRKGAAVGKYSIIANVLIVLAAFMLQTGDIESTLITIIVFFYTGMVLNQVHTKHKRFTAFIVSDKPEILVKAIHTECGRGVTLFKAEGTFQQKEKQVLMTVISSYQLYLLKDIIIQNDPAAFVNIMPTKDVYGNFVRKKMEIPLK